MNFINTWEQKAAESRIFFVAAWYLEYLNHEFHTFEAPHFRNIVSNF